MEQGYYEDLHEQARVGKLEEAVDRMEQQLKEMGRRLGRDRARANDYGRDIDALRNEVSYLKKHTGLADDRTAQWLEEFAWAHRK